MIIVGWSFKIVIIIIIFFQIDFINLAFTIEQGIMN